MRFILVFLLSISLIGISSTMDLIYDEIDGAEHSFFVSKNKENMEKIFKFFVENRN